MWTGVWLNVISVPPPDWADAVARSDLLYAPDDQSVASNLKATIGNGYLAMQLDSPILFLAGVFNGAGTKTPSHRAAVSSPLNLALDDSFSSNGSALDLRGGRCPSTK